MSWSIRAPRALVAAVLLVALAAPAAPAAAVPSPVVPSPVAQLLPLPEGFSSSVAHAVNRSRVAVGTASTDDGATRAVLWRDGSAAVLPVPDGDVRSAAYAVNDRGDVVGEAGGQSWLPRVALLWPTGATAPVVLAPLPDPHPWEWVYGCGARAVDDSGRVVAGVCQVDVNGSVLDVPVVWRDRRPIPLAGYGRVLALTPTGARGAGTHLVGFEGETVARRWDGLRGVPVGQDLPALRGGESDTAARDLAVAANGAVTVVGASAGRAVLWRWHGLRALPDLPDAVGGSSANALADGAHVVGTSGGTPTVWLFSVPSALPGVDGAAARGEALGMGTRRLVVGWTLDAAGRRRATTWTLP